MSYVSMFPSPALVAWAWAASSFTQLMLHLTPTKPPAGGGAWPEHFTHVPSLDLWLQGGAPVTLSWVWWKGCSWGEVFDEDASRAPPGQSVLGTSHREEARGKSWTHWSDYISWLGWEHLGVPPDKLQEGAGEREVKASLLRLLAPQPHTDKWNKMDGWRAYVAEVIFA